ncbi:unnamed protein product [Brassica rapa]|uniref:Uncharacterized protein n=2 Tax=Brassica TaxID=3705 RepID=A0A3P5ZZX2_BRACM|nr:unnamed protein product [Brassica napus]CAG7878673.1 unnamed protein product [Brassica rapa]CDY11179.1 BnaA03g00150D [Brassica napus]VDC78180.1 unnamed protein product [Brassica rapa]
MRASMAASRLSDNRKLFRVLPTIQRYLYRPWSLCFGCALRRK